jgi:hypothetical protein
MGSPLSALRVGAPHLGSRVTFSHISSTGSPGSPGSPGSSGSAPLAGKPEPCAHGSHHFGLVASTTLASCGDPELSKRAVQGRQNEGGDVEQ